MKTITLSWNEIRDRAFLFQKEWETQKKKAQKHNLFTTRKNPSLNCLDPKLHSRF